VKAESRCQSNEFLLRFGIELKVVRAPTRELQWTDRETQVAVDIGNRSAGKEALGKAAEKLVVRLLPKLVK